MSSFSLICGIFYATTTILTNSNGLEWIINRHPGLTDEFSLQMKNSTRVSSYGTFIEMSAQQREGLCKDVSKAIIFEYENDDYNKRPRIKPIPIDDFDYAGITSDVELFYREHKTRPFPTLKESVLLLDVESMMIYVYTIPCFVSTTPNGYSWSLAAGFEEGSLMMVVTQKNGENEKNTIVAVVEPSPILNNMNPEMSFLSDLMGAAGLAYTRSVCLLDAVEKFRLCSSVFRKYMSRLDVRKMYAVNYIRDVPNCMEGTLISFASSHPAFAHLKNAVRSDLLPCVVNEALSEPHTFYVTADPKMSSAVYVMESPPAVVDSYVIRPNTPPIDERMQRRNGSHDVDTLKIIEARRMSSTTSQEFKNYFIVMHVLGISVLS